MRSICGHPRGALGVALLGILLALAPGRSAASPPLTLAMAARELLALSPQAVAELPIAVQAQARARLARALGDQAAAGLRPLLLPTESRLAPAVQLPLTPGLQKVLALDLQRRARQLEPVLVAALLPAALKPLGAPGLLDPPDAPGELSARLLLPAGLTPAAAATLRRLGERAAAQWPTLLDGATVRLMAGMPFAVMLSQPERVVYVNPVLLVLLGTPAAAADRPGEAARLPVDAERALTYRSVADCAEKVQIGCRACLQGDAAECAAVRATLTHLACQDVGTDLAKLGDLCVQRALQLRSVADCVTQSDPACAAAPAPARCRAVVDSCIANPAAGAAAADGGRLGQGTPVAPDLNCGAAEACNRECAGSCGECGRQAGAPLGESCSNQIGKSCSDSCSDCNSQCVKGCDAGGSLCSGCNQGCQGCSSECNRGCTGCTQSCSQCNSDCNQCNSDCNQCNSDCANCSSQCNQCNGDCGSCGNQCNQFNGQCGSCGNQCSLVGGSGGYPRFPSPPGPADPPTPLARRLVGARGAVAFTLPPLLFLWWRRRLYGARRPRSEAAG